MESNLTREDALDLLREYNTEDFHLKHALTVEAVMGEFADRLGYGEDRDFWRMSGLLHDIDFERYPDEHCKRAPEILEKAGASPELIHAVCSHGYGICSDVEPEHEMEKVLFACDELTGLIGAAVLMRPSKSAKDMKLKSLKKKFKSRSFAAGCDRDIIKTGAERLNWELDKLLSDTLEIMKDTEDEIKLSCEELQIEE